MNNLFRTGLAGAAAYKWSGGIISTIVIFVLVFCCWASVKLAAVQSGRKQRLVRIGEPRSS